MKYVDVMFGPYLPDIGGMPNPAMPGYLVDAVNIRSTPNGWRGMPTFANVTSATAIGAATVTFGIGACYYTEATTHFFVAIQGAGFAALWESRAEGTDTWQDVTPGAGTFSAVGDFFRFGDNVVFTSGPQATLIQKDLTAAHATDFASIAGSVAGATGARVRQHAVVGGGLLGPYTVRTSAIGDHTDFPTPGTADARSKEAISEDLNSSFGSIRKVIGGEKIGLVVQEGALTRMTYVGGSAVYEFDTYDTSFGHGTKLFSHPVTDGKVWYLFNDNGVFVTDGYSVTRLSVASINEALFNNSISHPNGTSLEASYTSAFDRTRNVIVFGGPENDAGARYQLAYNINDGTFSLANQTNEMGVFSGFEVGSSAAYGITRTPRLYALNATDRKLQKLNGATGTIALQTGYLEIEPGYRVQIQKAHLLGTGVPGSLALSVKTAADLASVDTLQTGFTSMTAVSRGEGASARVDAPYVAFRVTGTGAESQLIRGIRIFYEKTSQL